MTPGLLYALTGVALMVIGLHGLVVVASTLRRILAANVIGTGVLMLAVAGAWRPPPLSPDPIPHAMALTGVVVAVSATALALRLATRAAKEPVDGASDDEGPSS